MRYSLYIGRFQPFHGGHEWCVRQMLDEGKKVCIAIMDIHDYEPKNNPYPTEEVRKMVIQRFYDEVNYLSPFGSGNSEPKFVIENIKVISSNIIGNNHIKSILCGKDGSTFKAFAWNAKNTPLEPFLSKENKKRINIAGKMRLNEWKGKRNIHYQIPQGLKTRWRLASFRSS